jgi:hypothetical protein
MPDYTPKRTTVLFLINILSWHFPTLVGLKNINIRMPISFLLAMHFELFPEFIYKIHIKIEN